MIKQIKGWLTLKTAQLGIMIVITLIYPFLWIDDKIYDYQSKKREKKMDQIQEMKDAVLVTAKQLAHPNNTFTTLEVKNKLIVDFPQYYWKQNSGILHVSGIMDEYAQAGVFTYTDNGTFRTYSDPNYNFPTQTTMTKTTPRRRGTPLGAKRGSYMTKTKRAAILAASHRRGSKLGVKRGPYKTKKMAIVSTMPLTTPLIPTVANLVKTLNKIKNPLHNVRAISKTDAAMKLLAAQGKFGKAIFIKKDNTERIITFKVCKDQTINNLGYVKVIDMDLYNKNRVANMTKTVSEQKAIRNVNIQTLKQLTLAGVTNKVR